MLQKINWSTAVQVVAIGMLLVGIAVASFSIYTESQSSSYGVQVDEERSSVNGSVPYESLSSAQMDVFDRIVPNSERTIDRQSAPVSGSDLAFYANNAVEYQGSYYTFEIIYTGEGSTVTTSFVAGGCVLSGVGFVLFLLPTSCTDDRRGIQKRNFCPRLSVLSEKSNRV
ncbi:hypothetical protein [Halocatena salina]|uniref:DUF7979 domain-containing protein n=1 Tax=Halocatena salina TaxID=2934340 RepID=A0A8U0A3C4_9EURY|nr:hypothetical protein [Halocatena salina]UPM42938.1 hypothetical protein MW046_00435 [Halocatena salina]